MDCATIEPDEYVFVMATAVGPDGTRRNVYAGSMPKWAWETPDRSMAAWKRAKRAVVLDEIGTCGDGWRVSFYVSKCQHEATHHSDDLLTVYVGRPEPLALCGYHAHVRGLL